MSQLFPDLHGYFRQFTPRRDELLLELEQQARQEGIPIVGPVVGEFLYILACLTGAGRVLELGTASGYSAIYLGRACQRLNGRLISLERDRSMARRAQRNLARAGLEQWVEIRTGEAIELMATMAGFFDLLFMDIDKEQYAAALPHCSRLLRARGLLVADNAGFQGADDFNHKIFSDQRWQALHLLAFLPGHSPELDGLALALRLG